MVQRDSELLSAHGLRLTLFRRDPGASGRDHLALGDTAGSFRIDIKISRPAFGHTRRVPGVAFGRGNTGRAACRNLQRWLRERRARQQVNKQCDRNDGCFHDPLPDYAGCIA